MIIAHIRHSLGQSLRHRLAEWGLAAIAFGLGWLLLVDERTFQSPSFAEMARIFDQQEWGFLCVILGGGRLMALLINGAWRRSPHLRSLFAIVSCFLWFQLALGFAAAGTGSTGSVTYSVLLIMDLCNAYRAAHDAGVSDRVHGNGERRGGV